MTESWIEAMIEAYNMRPWRAEPLWELAKHFRLKEQHKAAWLFIERGLQLDETPRDDTLFIEEFPHKWGFKEEAQICGFYAPTPEGRDLGHAACEELALSREAPFYLQDNAWRNLFWYARPLKEAAPSFKAKQITFIPPDSYRPMNPSVCRLGDKMVINVRSVNYRIGDDGRYVMPEHEPDIRTRNFLFELHEDLTFSSMGEVFEPADLPPMAWTGVQGFEDLRLFTSRGKLWSISSVRQMSSDGCNEMVVAMISTEAGNARLSNWKVLTQQTRQVEKNWIPVMSRDTGWSADDGPGATVLKCFIYRCDPFRTVDSLGNTIEERGLPIVAREWGGSSQAIPFDDGYLMVVHERIPRPGFGQRQYQRRFVWLDSDLHIRKLSRRFSLTETGQGEFCCGICWHPDGERLVLSWGVLDREAWLGTIGADDVRRMLYQPKALVPELPAPKFLPEMPWDRIPNPERAAIDDTGMKTSVEGRGRLDDGAGSSSEVNARPSQGGGALASIPQSVSWLDRNTNSALQNEGDLKWAITCVQSQGWPTHLDTTKHWDSYIAIEHTLKHAAKDERILDAGADRVSTYLPTLAKLGYTKLLGLNLLEPGWEAVENVVYGRGNIERTLLDDEAFAFVACLSVIEHGVNTLRFLQEAARILRPGGHLFVSTDYWRNPINTGIQDWKIFLPEEIEVLEKHANRFGLVIAGPHPLDRTCSERVCHHAGQSYTFINMLFQKKEERANVGKIL